VILRLLHYIHLQMQLLSLVCAPHYAGTRLHACPLAHLGHSGAGRAVGAQRQPQPQPQARTPASAPASGPSPQPAQAPPRQPWQIASQLDRDPTRQPQAKPKPQPRHGHSRKQARDMHTTAPRETDTTFRQIGCGVLRTVRWQGKQSLQ
jgi:hypothetical protein